MKTKQTEGIERLGLLLPTQSWVPVHQINDHDAGVMTQTEVLELPHGCLVRTTTVQGNDGRFMAGTNTVATAIVFVPNLKLERHADTVEFVHKH